MLPILAGILGPLLGKVIDTVGEKLGVDMTSNEIKTKKLDLEIDLQKILLEQVKAENTLAQAQAAINMEEAKHENMFVSGARPFILWVCGLAMAYHFLVQPLLVFSMYAVGHHIELPIFDMDTLLTVALGMLGLGGLRTYERVKGVARLK